MKPSVSVCVPNLNMRRFLPERMESLLGQTVSDWELIVCDSYSNDGSWEFFQKFKSDPRVQLHQVPREGLYAGWNECLRRARGQYVYMATSDDTSHPAMLERMLAAFERAPDVDLCVCNFEFIDANSRVLGAIERNSPKRFLGDWNDLHSRRDGKAEFLISVVHGPSWSTMTTVLFRRSLLRRTGLFRTDVGSQADGEWAMRATLASDLVYLPQNLATWRRHEKQASNQWADKLREATHNILRMIDSVLDDPDAGLPPSWKAVPDWAEELRRLWRWEYWDSYQLYRGELLRHPGHFLKQLTAALRVEPSLVCHQLRNGFRWSPEFSPNRQAETMRLINLFEAPWPPQRLSP